MKEQEEQDYRHGDGGDHLTNTRLLARRRRFAEATEQLAEAFSLGECTEAEALDLKARICAQQGLLLQAEVCWRKAQSLDADNPAYADALTALRQSQRPFATWRRTAAWAGIAALLLILLGTLDAGHRSVIRSQLTLTQRLTALEVLIGELRGTVDRTAEATALAITAMAKVTDDATRQTSVDVQQAVADLRNEMDRRQQEWSARQEQSRNAMSEAINDRLRAEAKRQRETVEAKVGVAEARQTARDETLDTALQKMQKSLTAFETARTEEERKRGQTNGWNRVWAPDRLENRDPEVERMPGAGL